MGCSEEKNKREVVEFLTLMPLNTSKKTKGIISHAVNSQISQRT